MMRTAQHRAGSSRFRRGRAGRRNFDPVTVAATAGVVSQVVNTLTSLFGPRGGGGEGALPADPTDALTPEVRAWWNSGMGGQWFTDWLLAHKPEAFRWTIDQLLPLYYTALWASGRSAFWGTGNAFDPRQYRPGLTEDAYAAMGVDYLKTWEKYEQMRQAGVPLGAGTPGAMESYVMLPSAGPVNNPYQGGTGGGRSTGGGGTSGGGREVTASIDGTTLILLLAVAYFLFAKG